MNFNGVKYEFTATTWQYSGATWVFVSLPQEMSKEIRMYFKSEEEGWGRLKTTARVGSSQWETAIWFDTKANTYILPLKAEIRKKENIVVDQSVSVIVII